MKNCSFLKVCCFLCLSLLLLPLTARAAENIRLRYANFPPASTFPCVQMEQWAKVVSERTNGRLTIETFPGGTLLDARSMLRGIARGQADIGNTGLVYYPGTFPFFDLFGLPLGFINAQDAGKVAWEMYKKYHPKELAPYKVLLMFACAPSQIMSTVPIKSLDDLKNISLRASGSLSDVITALGGQSVSMPMSETPEALQKGVVKGVFSSWDTLKDLNFAESCRYGLTLNSSVYPFVVIMNKKIWEKLPKDIQETLDTFADEHNLWTGNYVDDWGQKALDWAIQEKGFELATLSDADKAKMETAVAPLLKAWVEKMTAAGIDGKAVLADVMARRDALNAAHKENTAQDGSAK